MNRVLAFIRRIIGEIAHGRSQRGGRGKQSLPPHQRKRHDGGSRRRGEGRR